MIVGRVATLPLYSGVSPLSLALSFELLVIKRESNEPPSGPVPKLWKREPLLSSHITKWKKAVTLILFIFLTVEPLPFLSLSADRPRKFVRVTPTFSSVRLSLPSSLSSGPFQAKNTGLGDLLTPFPTGEGQVGNAERPMKIELQVLGRRTLILGFWTSSLWTGLSLPSCFTPAIVTQLT